MTQNEVDRYVAIEGMLRGLKVRRDILRAKLISEFQAGTSCPDKGPYVLEYSEQRRQKDSWKTIAKRLAIRYHAKKYLRNLIAQMKTKTVPVLLVKPNPEWSRNGDHKEVRPHGDVRP